MGFICRIVKHIKRCCKPEFFERQMTADFPFWKCRRQNCGVQGWMRGSVAALLKEDVIR